MTLEFDYRDIALFPSLIVTSKTWLYPELGPEELEERFPSLIVTSKTNPHAAAGVGGEVWFPSLIVTSKTNCRR